MNFVPSRTPVISKYILVFPKKFDLNKMRFFMIFFKNAEIDRHFGTPLVVVFSRLQRTCDVYEGTFEF